MRRALGIAAIFLAGALTGMLLMGRLGISITYATHDATYVAMTPLPPYEPTDRDFQ